jgi:hypothetical protein
MIALCPTCHGAVTRGTLLLTDEMLYEWKRARPRRWAGVQVPPASLQKLLLGSIAVTGTNSFAVFDFGSSQSLSFHLDDTGTVLVVNADLSDQGGDTLLTMHANTVRDLSDQIHLENRPGRVRTKMDEWQTLMPVWAYQQLLRSQPAEVARGLPLFDIEVVKSGVVRVQGIWSTPGASVVITESSLVLLADPTSERPLALVGEGEHSVLQVEGPDILFELRSQKGWQLPTQ